jgi:hypothetical protein
VTQSTDVEPVVDGTVVEAPPASAFRRRSFAELAERPIDQTEGRTKVDKAELAGDEETGAKGTAFIITGFTMRDGATETGYVSVEAVTGNETDIVFNDSGTGVRDQLEDYLVGKGMISRPSRRSPWSDWEILDTERVQRRVSSKGVTTLVVSDVALYVKGGLRVSSYEYTDAKGLKIPAKTYYLD